ncbi:MAG: Peptide chain release factor 2 [Berkelbacteria bacterium GW2011_GWB1_38_5]|uniref:Peptide chain release factor 2 n=2 Tax=Candidatus Berkelbacteria TaxID=1618330 RepID=A0A0G0IQ39_9BACT|nr:MAG: Peptide chain release factor 2 [Berkelbacteria bacterium GW2011_GWA1_36_9]KKQ73621.1 MAG: Peptide chain release factor 2 [Berkelbacteria bacterium GW2011_GWB1_38_5]
MTTKEELGQILKIDEKKEKIAKLQAEMNNPSFWSNQQKSQDLMQELSSLGKIVQEFEQAETPDQLHELELKTLLNEDYDENNALISIHAGAGGTEAQDWAQMLLRMFERFADRRGFSHEILDVSSGEEVGIKSATLKISGPYTFGLLKSEAGVHRLVRISPYDADKARHTSFALVEVIPEIKNNQDINIDEKDLRIDVYRSGGHGGQSVNTTDSAVRITHLPTSMVVSCQNERSQLQNKAQAMKILQSRLLVLKLKEQKDETTKLRGEHLSAGWGNQIRSYVLQPYQQVKDHRTEVTSTNPTDVLNGNLDLFIEKYLKKMKG